MPRSSSAGAACWWACSAPRSPPGRGGGASAWITIPGPRFFPFELALFAAGALSHQIALPLARRAAESWQVVVAVLTLALAAGSTGLPLVEPARSALVFVLFFAALPFLFLFQRRRRWDALLGELSYPVYLTHWAVAMVALEIAHRLGMQRPPAFTAIVVGGSLAAAIGLDLLVARPVERLRSRIKRAAPSPPLPAAA
ncbi:MAG TPA: hypothetical protein VII63_08580 [Caulobacteraceae bacterium]